MDMLFLRPSTQEEALALLTQYKQDAMIVAGGTDAVLRLTQKKTAPAVILSLDAIPERHEIAASDDTVRLASGVTYNELLASDVLRLYRGLREAVLHLASPAIRAVATPVGNICTAAPAADCTTMLFALGASAVLASNRGERRVPLDAFFVSTYKTIRESDELVTAIEIPALRPGGGDRLLPAFPAQGAGYRQNSHRLPRAARRGTYCGSLPEPRRAQPHGRPRCGTGGASRR